MTLLSTILPLFLLIALGFVAVRVGYVDRAHSRPLGDFVMKIALPALIFDAVTGLPPGEALNWRFIGAYAAGSLVAFGAGLWLARRVMRFDLAAGAMVGLGMSGSNSGFMGYPVALGVIGAGAAPLLAQAMVVENVLMIPLALALSAGRGTGGRAVALRALGGVAANPIILALLAGLVFSVAGLRLPAVIGSSVGMLAGVAPPIALFVLGATIAQLPMAGVRGNAAMIVAGKLVLHPLAVLAALWLTPGIDGRVLLGGVILAAAPMMSVYPLFGARGGIEMLSATALLIAVLASFATMSLWIAGIGRLVGA